METTTVIRSAAFGSHVRVILATGAASGTSLGGLIVSPRRGWTGSARRGMGVRPCFPWPRCRQEGGCVRIFETVKSRRGTADARDQIEHATTPTYCELTQWVRPVGPPVNIRCERAGERKVSRSELFHHVIARETGGLAVDRRCGSVALFQVESGGLDAQRRQCDPRAAASPALFFRHRQHPTADPCVAPILGQKEPSNIDEPEFGPPVEPADDLPGLRIADEHGERAKIVVSGLAGIIGAQTIADYRCVGGIKLIGHRDVCIFISIVIWHIRLLVQLRWQSLTAGWRSIVRRS